MTRFDAPTFARAWLAVAHASASSKDYGMLDRTVAIEEYTKGVRLVATDRFLLLTAWVPDLEHALAGLTSRIRDVTTPWLDEAPIRTWVAADGDGRAKGMLGYLLRLCRREDPDDVKEPGAREVTLRFDERLAPPPGADVGFEEMDPSYVVLGSPDLESVYLPLYAGEYADWRRVVAGFTPQESPGLAFASEMLARVGAVGRFAEGPAVLAFSGESGAQSVQWPDSDPMVSGFVMPLRWLEPEPAAPGDGEAPDPEDGEDEPGGEPGGPHVPVDRVADTQANVSAGLVLVDAATQDPDTLLADARDLLVATQFGSSALLQRKLRVGAARAERIMVALEAQGVVGPRDNLGLRDVLVTLADRERDQ